MGGKRREIGGKVFAQAPSTRCRFKKQKGRITELVAGSRS